VLPGRNERSSSNMADLCARHRSVAVAQPSIADVEDALRKRLLDGRPQDVRELAEAVFCGKSSLQRSLDDLGTSFTEIRRRLRVEHALELLTEGKTVARTSAEVGISQSYLSKLVKAETGLTAGQIARAWTLTDRAQRWRAGVPPKSGTRLYWKRLDDWKRLEHELKSMMSTLPPDSPLRTWANLVVAQTRRPDFRTQPYRERVWGERRRERIREREAIEEAYRWWARMRAARDEAPAAAGQPEGVR
jgi:AraC-like DNA-binding protein